MAKQIRRIDYYDLWQSTKQSSGSSESTGINSIASQSDHDSASAVLPMQSGVPAGASENNDPAVNTQLAKPSEPTAEHVPNTAQDPVGDTAKAVAADPAAEFNDMMQKGIGSAADDSILAGVSIVNVDPADDEYDADDGNDMPISDPVSENEPVEQEMSQVQEKEYDAYRNENVQQTENEYLSDRSADNKPHERSQMPMPRQQSQPVSQPVFQPRRELLPEDEEGTVTIKNFPKAMVNRMKNMFPTANNQNDPIIAYIYLKEGQPPDMPVSDAVKALAASYSGEKVSARDIQLMVEKDLLQVDNRIRDMMKIVQAIELGVAYNTCKAAGLTRYEADDPGTVDFLEKNVLDLFARLERQSQTKVSKDNDKEGRDIYKSKYR